MIGSFNNSFPKLLNTSLRYLSTKKLPVLELFTKDPCPLCDIALDKISQYKDRFELRKVFITELGQEHWWDLYKYEIPVFHFNGKLLMKHKADLALLEKALDEFEQQRGNHK